MFLAKDTDSEEAFREILQNIHYQQEKAGVICHEIYETAWDICRDENEKQERLKDLYMPYNMIDVLHKLGNKKTSEYPMKYEYLWMAFLCSCFEKKISHNGDNSISVEYSQKEDLSEVNKVFMQLAYQDWKDWKTGNVCNGCNVR